MKNQHNKHITIDYGIDLGTTNSAICRMEQGTPNIIRTDAGAETMPSCISFKKGGNISIGSGAYAQLGQDKLRALKRRASTAATSCIEFKRYMGSDTTFNTANMEHIWTPEQLSAEVIKALCAFVSDDQVKAAVITVPAKFTVNQKDATLQAARLAGIEQVELLQEPIAASMAYGLKAEERNGIWMVFDFGGGTLDVALVRVDEGVMQVFDTEGDNYLGGKNIDEAIVREILLPRLSAHYTLDLANEDVRSLFIDALKVEAERLKIHLSYANEHTVYFEAGDWGDDADGEEIEMEITVTRSEMERAIMPILQKAVDVCKTLMQRNNLGFDSLSHLILVGGPTMIPLLRQMLRQQVTPQVDTDINPMTAVATGAAIYASTIPVIVNSEDAQDDTIQLITEFDACSVDTEAFIPLRTEKQIKGLKICAERRSDQWRSQQVVVTDKGTMLVLDLIKMQPNIFRLIATVDDVPVKCHPAEITIVQGTKTGSAVLPYNIGMEVLNPKKDKCVFVSFTGLEKNRPLPAIGNVYGLKTQTEICPGNENQSIKVPIYQGDDRAEGKTAALFEYVSEVRISGEDVPTYIPANCRVNIRIDVDRSEMMTVKAEFVDVGVAIEKRLETNTHQKSVSSDYLHDKINNARLHASNLQDQLDVTTELVELFKRIDQIELELNNNSQPKQIEQHLKEVLREIEDYEMSSEWDRAYKRVERTLYQLELECLSHDDPMVKERLQLFREQAKLISSIKDIVRINSLNNQMMAYIDALTLAKRYRNFILWAEGDFNYLKWRNKNKAMAAIAEGVKIIELNPEAPTSLTEPIVIAINRQLIRERHGSSDSDIIPTQQKCPDDLLSM